MLRSAVTLVLAGLAAVGCNVASKDLATPGVIIGETDERIKVTEDLEGIPQKFHSLIPAIGHMKHGCTATHIGQGFAITAGHCMSLYSADDANDECKTMTIAWGDVHKKEVPQDSNEETVDPFIAKCTEVVFYKFDYDNPGDGDVAVIKVDTFPEIALQVDLEISQAELVGKTISIFGYPQKLPLHWSPSCKIETEDDPEYARDIVHSCDTLGGNSGSSLIDEATMRIVGIHDGAANQVKLNYGSSLKHVSQDVWAKIQEVNHSSAQKFVTLE